MDFVITIYNLIYLPFLGDDIKVLLKDGTAEIYELLDFIITGNKLRRIDSMYSRCRY